MRRAEGAARQQADITTAEHLKASLPGLGKGHTLWVGEDVEVIEFSPLGVMSKGGASGKVSGDLSWDRNEGDELLREALR